MKRRPPTPTLFPYTTLFRSRQEGRDVGRQARPRQGAADRQRHRRHLHRGAPLEVTRSEEHTSELQSLRHLVCRLLLEKKKDKRHDPDKECLATHATPQRPLE